MPKTGKILPYMFHIQWKDEAFRRTWGGWARDQGRRTEEEKKMMTKTSSIKTLMVDDKIDEYYYECDVYCNIHDDYTDENWYNEGTRRRI